MRRILVLAGMLIGIIEQGVAHADGIHIITEDPRIAGVVLFSFIVLLTSLFFVVYTLQQIREVYADGR